MGVLLRFLRSLVASSFAEAFAFAKATADKTADRQDRQRETIKLFGSPKRSEAVKKDGETI